MCTDMVREWTPTARPLGEDVPVFGDTFERCPAAVSMTLPSRAVRYPAALFFPWMNHHGTYTIAELRRAPIGNPKLHRPDARRLVSSWLDFAYLQAQLESAQQPLQLPSAGGEQEPLELVPLASPEPAPRATPPRPQAQRALDPEAPSASSTSSGGRTFTSRRGATTPVIHRPVSLAPVAPWLTAALAASSTPATSTTSRALDSGSSSTSTVALLPNPSAESQSQPAADANNSATSSSSCPMTRARARLSPAKNADAAPSTPERP